MSWRFFLTAAVTLVALTGAVAAAVMAALATGEATALEGWALLLALVAAGASGIAAIGSYLIMRTRDKEEYREHFRPRGH